MTDTHSTRTGDTPDLKMVRALKIFLLASAAFLLQGAAGQSKLLVCYYTNWSQYRNGLAKFTPANLDPNLCTHIMFAFGKVVNKQIQNVEYNDLVRYKEVLLLKRSNPNLKVLLSIGGYNHPASEFSAIVADQASTLTFADNAIRWLRSNDLDGLDVDWEYPGSRGSPPEDKQRFTVFLQRLHAAFEAEGTMTGRPRLLLTAAVPAGETYINAGFEIDRIHPYLDFISMMGYDYHGTWDSYIDHHSPLYARSSEVGWRRNLNQDWSIQKWISDGFPREKVVLGVPSYGRGFKLASSGATTPGSPYIGASQSGPSLYQNGLLAYFEVCQLRGRSGWNRGDVPESSVSYYYGPDGTPANTLTWVGVEDVASIRKKANYAVIQGLAGITFWSLDFDDFTGSYCGEGAYPLISAARSVLQGGNPPTPATTTQPALTTRATAPTTQPTVATTPAPAPTQPPATTQATVATTQRIVATTQPPATTQPTVATTQRTVATTTSAAPPPPPPVSTTCTGSGLFPEPNNCSRFYYCLGGRKFYFTCPAQTVFDPRIKVCNWWYNVPGCN